MEGISRRRLLKGSGAALLGPWVITSSALGAPGVPSANERVTLGAIGVGGRGTGDLRGFLGLTQCLAICDVRQQRREQVKSMVERFYSAQAAKGTYKGCAACNDFREIIVRDDIDVVSITTPDHWHAIPGIMAARAGKDIFVEKPFTLNIAEGRAVVTAVETHGRILQLGTQQRSDGRFRFACELARNQLIGKVHTIRVGSPSSGSCPPQPPQPVPEGFDYDMWLGPAPWAAYTTNRCRTPWWYFIADYTMGFVSGWGIHHVDIAQWGNGSDDTGPVEIEGTGTFPNDGLCDTATSWRVVCTYANGAKMIFADNRKEKQGVVFQGTEGWVYVRRGFIDAHPKSLLSYKLGPNHIHLYRSHGHGRNLIECVRSRQQTVCPPETAHRANSICQLADIAIRLRRTMRWDPEKEQFINDDEANRMLSKAMREPWHL